MKYLLLIILLTGCATSTVRDTNPAMQEVYQANREVSFCLSPDGEVYNVLEFGYFTASTPVCKRDAIIMHSHPFWSPLFAGLADFDTWKRHNKWFGHEYFGVMKKHQYKVYHIKSKN